MYQRKKRGFTLAELLIVVAIIAVLVAIAVPLFVGALDDAEKRVGEANCRAVRAEAVKEILLDPDNQYKTEVNGKMELVGPWVAKGNVDANGTVYSLFILPAKKAGVYPDKDGNYKLELGTQNGTVVGEGTAIFQKGKDNIYYVSVLVSELTAESE